jgi:hypothetical protein
MNTRIQSTPTLWLAVGGLPAGVMNYSPNDLVKKGIGLVV